MNKLKIDSKDFYNMISYSLGMLKEKEQEINELNVFPVPDGDTGTNMRKTLESGLTNVNQEEDISTFLSKLSSNMLVGARGNSGVILSMIFKGISRSIKNKKDIDTNDFLNALKSAKDYVYSKLKNPVEGTIITVLKKSILIDDVEEDFNDLLSHILKLSKIALDETPNELKVLKDAHVIDAGGYGLYTIYFGMLSYLKGDYQSINISYDKATKIRYKDVKKDKKITYIVYSTGSLMKETFFDLGADVVLDCPITINPSTQEIIDAINKLNSEYIIILPNDKNAFLTTELALKILNKRNIYLLETKSLAEGYFALSMMLNTSDDIDATISSMKKGLNNTTTIKIIEASKTSSYNGKEYNKGDFMAITDDDILFISNNLEELVKKTLFKIDLSDKEIIAMFSGDNVDDNLKDDITNYVYDNYDNIDIGIIDGGFLNILFVIGIC